MRGKTAVPIIVVGLLLMLLGVAQLTVWAPAETVTASVGQDVRAGPVTVIETGARGDGAGAVDVTVQADGPFMLAVGRAADVEAWVGEAAHLSISGVTDEILTSEYSDGEEAVPDPRGSDLWISEEPGEGTLTYRWSAPVEGEWSILLAADGETPAPVDVSITRPNGETTPFALPLIIGGALVVTVGIALSARLPGRRHSRSSVEGTRAHARRRERNSARGVSMTGVRAATAGLVGVIAGVGVVPALAAAPPAAPSTSPSSTSTPLPTPTSTDAAIGAPSAGSEASGPPLVLDLQLARILEAVASAVAEADAAYDVEPLAARVSGAALDLRAGAFALRAADEQVVGPPPVAAGPVLLKMVPTSTEWPRTMVALTQGDDDPAPQALVLVQQSPRENYRLTSAVQMLPGGTFPSPPAPGATGPVPLDEDGTLSVAPQAAVALIADALTTPDGDSADRFEANSFAESITEFQEEIIADPGNDGVDITFAHTAETDRTEALLTGDGGAMVFGYLTHTYSSIPEDGDAIDLRDTVYESLTGEDRTEQGIDVTYGEAVMMYVPPAGSGATIRVIGATQQLLSAELR